MYKLAVVLLAAAAVAIPTEWPAGLNPATCPNYPYCDNAIVALYNSPPAPVAYAAPADGYPAGVSPAACPNYPFCGAAIPGYYARQYPAGVSPAACPNYPYC
uniref:Cuticle protein CPCFC domain-containing protein n=1 Tax=Clastoptera arizonana TaxID=38151 RepID=A0A1B6CST7_9HEMI